MTPAAPENETTDERAPRPFAVITPYSGPYPPDYVSVSSSEKLPGPINILSKWIGMLWSVVIVICIVVNSNSATTDHLANVESGEKVSPFFWLGLWAVVIVPAFVLYRYTRPKPLRERGAFASRKHKSRKSTRQ